MIAFGAVTKWKQIYYYYDGGFLEVAFGKIFQFSTMRVICLVVLLHLVVVSIDISGESSSFLASQHGEVSLDPWGYRSPLTNPRLY